MFQPDGRAFEAFGAIILSDGTIVCSTYKVSSSSSAGDGWQNGVRASMVPVCAGLMRAAEVKANAIRHAIAIVMPPKTLHTSWTYPALSFDRGALRESPSYSGPFPMGSRFALPAGTDIAGLSLQTAFGAAVALATRDYGLILVDRGGSGCTLMVEDQVADLAYSWSVQSDLNKLVKLLRYVTINPGEFTGSITAPAEPNLSLSLASAFSAGTVPVGTAKDTNLLSIAADSGSTLSLVYNPTGKFQLSGTSLKLVSAVTSTDTKSLPYAIRATKAGEGRTETGRFLVV